MSSNKQTKNKINFVSRVKGEEKKPEPYLQVEQRDDQREAATRKWTPFPNRT